MTELAQISMKAINKWFYFSYNYPYNFIECVWGKNGLAEHLTGKFTELHSSYGSRAVMNQFYAELDMSNKKRLLEWVLDNYNDECKLSFSEEE